VSHNRVFIYRPSRATVGLKSPIRVTGGLQPRDLVASAVGLAVGLAVRAVLAAVAGGRTVLDILGGASPGLVVLVAAAILVAADEHVR
jgi:hypothetical protein